jgi:hypothetical protein
MAKKLTYSHCMHSRYLFEEFFKAVHQSVMFIKTLDGFCISRNKNQDRSGDLS